jgi:FMN reductase
MALIVTISGSPSATSRTTALAQHVGAQLAGRGFEVRSISVRDLDPEALLHGRADAPGVREAIALVASADAVVIATPVYKAAYTGVLKAFLDLLPQFGLAGKTVLPLATGGTIAHVLAIDYGLRPVLASLGALHIVNGLFVLDKLLEHADTGLKIDAEIGKRLDGVIDEFALSVGRHHGSQVPGVTVIASASA